jgi:hypothetical protein
MKYHAPPRSPQPSATTPSDDQSGSQPQSGETTTRHDPSSLAGQLGISQPAKSPDKENLLASQKVNILKPSDLESRATKLLTALLTSNAFTSDELSAQWSEIASVFTQLNKIREAAEAITEAAFECRVTGDQRWGQLMTQLTELISTHGDEWYGELAKPSDNNPLSESRVALIKRSDVSKSFGDALSMLYLIEQLPPTTRHEPLTHYLVLVTEVAERWRKKERWLIWWKLANLNDDPRLLAREREALLNHLNEEGMIKTDLPQAVIQHLLQH